MSVLSQSTLSIKVFADGADVGAISALAQDPMIKGFTTNPTLMRKAGVTDYEAFARDVLTAVPNHPVSLEVFSDDFEDMERQAMKLASWGSNVYVKIPVTNTCGEPSDKLVRRLSDAGVRLNVTAILTVAQVRTTVGALGSSPGAIVSVFAGRIADTGRDPVPIMTDCLELVRTNPSAELLWASPREVLNIVQADSIGCDIITVTYDLLQKLSSIGRDLDGLSLDTVNMFHNDAESAGFVL